MNNYKDSVTKILKTLTDTQRNDIKILEHIYSKYNISMIKIMKYASKRLATLFFMAYPYMMKLLKDVKEVEEWSWYALSRWDTNNKDIDIYDFSARDILLDVYGVEKFTADKLVREYHNNNIDTVKKLLDKFPDDRFNLKKEDSKKAIKRKSINDLIKINPLWGKVDILNQLISDCQKSGQHISGLLAEREMVEFEKVGFSFEDLCLGTYINQDLVNLVQDLNKTLKQIAKNKKNNEDIDNLNMGF